MSYELSQFLEGAVVLAFIAGMIAPLWPGRRKRSHPHPTDDGGAREG